MAVTASSVLSHPQIEEIERRILTNESVRKIALSVSPPVGYQAVQRHKNRLIGNPVVKPAQAVTVKAAQMTRKALAAIQVVDGRYDITVVTRDWVLANLYDIANNGKNESSRVRATELCGKELNMFVEQSIHARVDLNKTPPNLATLPQADFDAIMQIYLRATQPQLEQPDVIDIAPASANE